MWLPLKTRRGPPTPDTSGENVSVGRLWVLSLSVDICVGVWGSVSFVSNLVLGLEFINCNYLQLVLWLVLWLSLVFISRDLFLISLVIILWLVLSLFLMISEVISDEHYYYYYIIIIFIMVLNC